MVCFLYSIYYFGKALSHAADDSCDSSRSEPIVIAVGKKKRPVGRPRKVRRASTASSSKLVDYSSTNSESEVEKVSLSIPPVDPPALKSFVRCIPRDKKVVAAYARFHGVRVASRHFRVHHKNVSRRKSKQVI